MLSVIRRLARVGVGSTRVRGDLGGEVGPTSTRPVLIGYDPVRDPEQPRPVGLSARDVPEPPPGHCEHFGRAVFGIARTDPPQAVAEDGLVMRLEKPVETLLSFARRTDHTARGHSRLSLGTLGVRVALIAYTPSVVSVPHDVTLCTCIGQARQESTHASSPQNPPEDVESGVWNSYKV